MNSMNKGETKTLNKRTCKGETLIHAHTSHPQGQIQRPVKPETYHGQNAAKLARTDH